MDSGKLAGQVAVVTGASRGIGAAVAARLARDGASVAVNYWKSEASAASVVDKIVSNGGKARAFKADVSDPVQARDLIQGVVEVLGPVDIVVNNAGTFSWGPLDAIDEAHIRSLIQHNLYGPIFVTQAALPHLARSKTGGRVINVSSIASHHPVPGVSLYAASKGALNALTKTWANELGPKGITVNAVAPGAVETDMLVGSGYDENVKQFVVSRTCLGRPGQPADIADAIAILASPDAHWITGQVIDIGGGFLP